MSIPEIICPKCGFTNEAMRVRCKNCGRPLRKLSSSSKAASMSSAPPLPPLVPIPSPRSSPVPAPAPSSPPVPYSPAPPVSRPSPSAGRVTPQLEGRVVDVYELRVKKPSGWAGPVLKGMIGLMLLPFRPLMVLMAMMFQSRSATEMQEIIVLRVEDSGGMQTESRIEGELMSAGVRLGDEVILWGTYRSGNVLKVSRGYNKSARADIHIKREGNFQQLLQIAAIIVIVIAALSLCSLMMSFMRY